MSLNLHLLRLFATVARLGSFSRAAEELHISQPAISKSVRDFELQVGCRLLDRNSHGVTPTREGEALARHAATLFAVERAAEEELRALRGLHQGLLRIGASTTIATYMIAEQLGAFHAAHPKIDLHILSANTQAVADMMLGHDIDVALVEGPVENPALTSLPWRQDAMVLIAAPSHPFATRAGRSKGGAVEPEAIEPEALADELQIVREPGSGTLQVVNEALAARGIVPGRKLEVGSTEAIKQVVAAGVGVAFVSAATVKDQVALGRLRIIPVRDFAIERTLWRIDKPGRLESPAAIAFKTLIQ